LAGEDGYQDRCDCRGEHPKPVRLRVLRRGGHIRSRWVGRMRRRMDIARLQQGMSGDRSLRPPRQEEDCDDAYARRTSRRADAPMMRQYAGHARCCIHGSSLLRYLPRPFPFPSRCESVNRGRASSKGRSICTVGARLPGVYSEKAPGLGTVVQFESAGRYVICHFLSSSAQNAHPDMNIRSLQTNEITMALSVALRVRTCAALGRRRTS